MNKKEYWRVRHIQRKNEKQLEIFKQTSYIQKKQAESINNKRWIYTGVYHKPSLKNINILKNFNFDLLDLDNTMSDSEFMYSIREETKDSLDELYLIISEPLIKKAENSRNQRNYLKRRPINKLIANIRSNINRSIENKGYTKKTNAYKILGCEYNVFAEWLDLSKYNEDSHLDHVVPISLADTEEEVLMLNHYSNFQILTSKENITKGNRYINNDNLQRVLNNHPQPSVVQEIVNRSNIEIKNP